MCPGCQLVNLTRENLIKSYLQCCAPSYDIIQKKEKEHLMKLEP